MRKRVVVVGASGFGRECLDVLEAMVAAGTAIDIVGVVDDGPSPVNLERLASRGVRHLGGLGALLALEEYADCSYVLGIGHPQTRRRLVERFDAAGRKAFTAIHPSAVIGSGCSFGEGVVVCSAAVISTNVRLGRHVHVNPNATIGHDAILDDFVSINPAAVLSGEVVIERRVLVGAAATVLQRLQVGQDTVVGAGSVVTRSVPNSQVVKGVPGRWP